FAKRFAGFEVRAQFLQQRGFIGAFLVELLLLVLRDAVEARLNETEIADRELEVHRLDVPQRIDRAVHVKHGRVPKGTNDMAERVHVLEFIKPLLPWLRLVGWGRGERALNLRVL